MSLTSNPQLSDEMALNSKYYTVQPNKPQQQQACDVQKTVCSSYRKALLQSLTHNPDGMQIFTLSFVLLLHGKFVLIAHTWSNHLLRFTH